VDQRDLKTFQSDSECVSGYCENPIVRSEHARGPPGQRNATGAEFVWTASSWAGNLQCSHIGW
jgi:hypothetical protein